MVISVKAAEINPSILLVLTIYSTPVILFEWHYVRQSVGFWLANGCYIKNGLDFTATSSHVS